MPTALVTGANRGLGLETATQLAHKGYTVYLTSRSDSGREEAGRLQGQGLDVKFLQLDVADGQSIAEVAELFDERSIALDALINNAGIHYDTFQTALTADFSIVAEAFEVNFLGPWRLTKALLPALRRARNARVVMVSSSSGSFSDSWPGTPAYSSSKAALNMLTVKMAADLEKEGMKVNAVCPGWVRTRMGGQEATRSPAEGAAGIVWAATLGNDGPTGGFFRDGEPISW